MVSIFAVPSAQRSRTRNEAGSGVGMAVSLKTHPSGKAVEMTVRRGGGGDYKVMLIPR